MRTNIFDTLSKAELFSIVNFHVIVAMSDGKMNNQEGTIVEFLLSLFSVDINECLEYYEYEGKDKELVNDLKNLPFYFKEIIVITIWHLIICDGKPNKNELSVSFRILREICIDQKKFYEILENEETMKRRYDFLKLI